MARPIVPPREDAAHHVRWRDAIMIGDHVHDMTAAKQIGLFGVRASWNGYWGAGACELADRQFHSVSDFTTWVDRVIANGEDRN